MGLSVEYLKQCLITEYYTTKNSGQKHGCCFCEKPIIKRKVKCKGSCPDHYRIKHFIFCTNCWQVLLDSRILKLYSRNRNKHYKEKIIDKFMRIICKETNSLKSRVNF